MIEDSQHWSIQTKISDFVFAILQLNLSLLYFACVGGYGCANQDMDFILQWVICYVTIHQVLGPPQYNIILYSFVPQLRSCFVKDIYVFFFS